MVDTQSCFLIDGHFRLYKAFFAVRGLSTPDGTPIGAVYGFTGTLLKLIRERQPDFLAVVFDRPGKTFRHDIYPDYKATRKPRPDDFKLQEPLMKRVLEAMQIPVLGVDGHEADDVLGTLAHRFAGNGCHVHLVTNDKDARQLLGPDVTMFDADNLVDFSADDLQRDTGLRPDQIIELMALTGDTSDNVPGVPKVGEKTAIPLIARYGSLAGVLEHVDDIAGDDSLDLRGKAGVASRIKEHADSARLSRELVTIDIDAPIEVGLDDLRIQPVDPARVLPVFQEFGFTNYVRDLGLIQTDAATARERYSVVETPADLDALLPTLQAAEALSLVLLTTGGAPMQTKLAGIALSTGPDSGWYLPFVAPGSKDLFADDPVLDRDASLAALAPVLGDAALPKLGHNLNEGLIVLQEAGATLAGIAGDTMVEAWLLHPGRANLGLEHLAVEFLGRELIKREDVAGSGRDAKPLHECPVAEVGILLAERADVNLQIHRLLQQRIADIDLTDAWRDVELPMIEVLVDMQRRGVCIDTDALGELDTELGGAADDLEREIHTLAGHEFNIRSPKQLQQVLFEERGFTPVKRTKSGPSTDEATLEELAAQGDDLLPRRILEYREVHKLLSGWVQALPKTLHPQTGRVHTTYHQCVTPTGRLSSSDPNLQNIPVRSEHGRRVRKAFVAEPGSRLLALDYSQIELRLVAHLSGDETMIAAFAQDRDIHRAVAAQVNNVAEADVTPAMRSAAKAINFGIIYGQTAFGLAANLGIGRREAQQFIDAYFANFPKVRDYIDQTIEQAHADGYVATLLGRRRYLPELKASNRMRRERAEREAVNTTAQGSAADLIKIAMVRLEREINAQGRPLSMLLQIHDELVFECPEDAVDEQAAFARDVMEEAMELRVPLKVDVATGRSWYDA